MNQFAREKNMDEQDRQDAKNLHRELTRQVIGCAFEVIHDLGSGFLESVYEKAMMPLQ